MCHSPAICVWVLLVRTNMYLVCLQCFISMIPSFLVFWCCLEQKERILSWIISHHGFYSLPWDDFNLPQLPFVNSVTIHTFDVYREEIYEDVCKKVSETAREADQSMARKLAHKYNHTGKLDNINIPVIRSIQHV